MNTQVNWAAWRQIGEASDQVHEMFGWTHFYARLAASLEDKLWTVLRSLHKVSKQDHARVYYDGNGDPVGWAIPNEDVSYRENHEDSTYWQSGDDDPGLDPYDDWHVS